MEKKSENPPTKPRVKPKSQSDTKPQQKTRAKPRSGASKTPGEKTKKISKSNLLAKRKASTRTKTTPKATLSTDKEAPSPALGGRVYLKRAGVTLTENRPHETQNFTLEIAEKITKAIDIQSEKLLNIANEIKNINGSVKIQNEIISKLTNQISSILDVVEKRNNQIGALSRNILYLAVALVIFALVQIWLAYS